MVILILFIIAANDPKLDNLCLSWVTWCTAQVN